MTYRNVCFTALLTVASLAEASGQIDWLSWEQALDKQAEAPRKILVDVYTDWCGWCAEMDRRTFADSAVAALVNANFYPVKLDAEYEGDLTYRGDTFSLEHAAGRPTHALARELLGGRLAYPTVVFLSEDGVVLQAIPGFRDASSFQHLAEYFERDRYRDVSWGEYVGD